MLGETKNLKDATFGNALALKDSSFTFSYTKTNKLIAGLYMVTDIMDKDEPMRLKLRSLGVAILSDISSSSTGDLEKKIHETLSFLDIASVVGIISQMNHAILKKEFIQLQESIKEAMHKAQGPSLYAGQLTLSSFMKEDVAEFRSVPDLNNKKVGSIGQVEHIKIGVQKGHSLMKALSEVQMSNREDGQSFGLLKKERRDQIVKIIKNNPNGATIKDIKAIAKGLPASEAGALASCGEKTLQRELIAMLKDNILRKTGEKRWSRYFLIPS